MPVTADIRELPRPNTKRLSLLWVKDLPEHSQKVVTRIARDLAKDSCGLLERDIPLLIELGRVLEDIRTGEMFAAQAVEVGDSTAWARMGRKLDSSRRLMTGLLGELRMGHRAEVLSKLDSSRTPEAVSERLSASRWKGIL